MDLQETKVKSENKIRLIEGQTFRTTTTSMNVKSLTKGQPSRVHLSRREKNADEAGKGWADRTRDFFRGRLATGGIHNRLDGQPSQFAWDMIFSVKIKKAPGKLGQVWMSRA